MGSDGERSTIGARGSSTGNLVERFLRLGSRIIAGISIVEVGMSAGEVLGDLRER